MKLAVEEMTHLRRINVRIRHKVSEKGIKRSRPFQINTTSYSFYNSYLGGICRTAQPYPQDKTELQSVECRQRLPPIPPKKS